MSNKTNQNPDPSVADHPVVDEALPGNSTRLATEGAEMQDASIEGAVRRGHVHEKGRVDDPDRLRAVPDTERVGRDPRANVGEGSPVYETRKRIAEVEAGRNPDGTPTASEAHVAGHSASQDKYGGTTSRPRKGDGRQKDKLALGGVQADGSKVEALHVGSSATRPVTGEWHLGDLVFNSKPAPGGFIGWCCVASTQLDEAGNEAVPAVWRHFGLIEN